MKIQSVFEDPICIVWPDIGLNAWPNMFFAGQILYRKTGHRIGHIFFKLFCYSLLYLKSKKPVNTDIYKLLDEFDCRISRDDWTKKNKLIILIVNILSLTRSSCSTLMMNIEILLILFF
jgi:hypothetical protein